MTARDMVDYRSTYSGSVTMRRAAREDSGRCAEENRRRIGLALGIIIDMYETRHCSVLVRRIGVRRILQEISDELLPATYTRRGRRHEGRVKR